MKTNLNDLLVRQKAIVQKGMFKTSEHDVYSVVNHNLVKALAQHIANNNKLNVVEEEFHVELEMELIVATKSEFMKLVNEKAEELSWTRGNFNPNCIEFIGEDKNEKRIF